ncbi:MAG: hypothetical protein IKY62_01430 [Clostridia bacterium]|nr:hypothetical protein [Clostridia bacterium]
MKARIPKAYHDLTPRQKEQLTQYCIEIATEEAKKQEEADCRIILNLYMKMVCCVLHDAFGFGEKRLSCFIGNHRQLFLRQNRLLERGEQIEYLNRRMDEIFKKDGFPQAFIDGLFEEIDIRDKEQNEE